MDVLPEALAERRVGDRAADETSADPGVLERLGQQILEVQHGHAAGAERVGERVVLLPGALHPQHVVEQELVLVGRRQPLELAAGPVEDDPPQDADLGVDAQTGMFGAVRLSLR